MDKLIIRRPGATERELLLQESTTTIGRHQQCTLQLEDPQISRVHAILTRTEGGYLLADQGSMNGTQLNGRKLGRGEQVMLAGGDVLRLQSFDLELVLAGAPAPKAPKAPKAPTSKTHSDTAVLAGSPQPRRAPGSPPKPPPTKVAQARPATEGLPAATPAAAPRPITRLPDELDRPPEASILLSHLMEDRARHPVWSKGEIVLRVADIIQETGDTKTFRLVGKQDSLFSYKPGQFVTIQADIEGKPVKRSYSISSSPSRPHTLELTVKRVPGGLVSNWMNDELALGDELLVRGPSGKFSCFNYPSRKMLCIAGGSGITPIMSMVRWIVDTTADVDVVLLYSVRSPANVIFRKELEYISARHSGLRVIFTMTSSWYGTESWTGFTGRIDKRMLDLIAPDLAERHVFLCGPKPFGEAVKCELKALEYPLANLHQESFGVGRLAAGTPVEPRRPKPVVHPVPAPASAPAARPPAAAPAAAPPPAKPAAAPAAAAAAPAPAQAAAPAPAPPAAPAGFKVKFAKSGREALAGAEEKLLDVAEMNGVEIEYACREGSCGSCRTMCVSGTVQMEDNDLDQADREAGWVYPCVAHAISDVVLEA